MKRMLLLCASLACTLGVAAQPVLDFQPLSLSGPAIVSPVDITGAGDGSGRLFVVEKPGTIRIIENNVVLNDYFLDISSQVEDGGERGLLGLAFHPDFPTEPYFYVNYVGLFGPDTTYISRFRVNPLDPNDGQEQSELVMLKVAQPYTNHNSGDLAFSPIDGYLYVPLGDGGLFGDPEESGQDSMSVLGKILRLDVDASPPYIPAGNPFTSNPNILDEIWAFGLRNPWRISFDRATGDLWIADVGQNMWEEVHFQAASSPGGENYGWDCYEGNNAFELTDCASSSAYIFPIFEYPHNCNQGCPLG
ncbi:MAG: PQQ-dependent sugar dehydrogenase, partial [Saprospiraceae bacterium]|nr:PQQ-dependent sugar dehydrogenase [Saprospiraceae bacterium]